MHQKSDMTRPITSSEQAVVAPRAVYDWVPSLLGLDLLTQWSIECYPRNGALEFSLR